MWILGFDSTASTVSAAVVKDGHPIATYSAESATSHSTTLLPAIEKLLSACGIKASDLDLISCSAGPGSFTGVRIGVATAKGLAAPFDTPTVGVSSLEAMAHMYTEIPSYIFAALGARRGNVYGALFLSDGNGNITRLTDDDLISIESAKDYIDSNVSENEFSNTLFIVGDSIHELSEVCAYCTFVKLSTSPALLTSPSGYGAAVCGIKKFNSAEDPTLFTSDRLMPIYLRKSQAERERDEKKLSF